MAVLEQMVQDTRNAVARIERLLQGNGVGVMVRIDRVERSLASGKRILMAVVAFLSAVGARLLYGWFHHAR